MQTGNLRLKWTVSNADIEVYLPPPKQGGITLEFVRKFRTVDLLDGSERTRLLGYIPLLTVKWGLYIPEDTGKTLGITDECAPTLPQLLTLLSVPLGKSISPGTSAGYFALDTVQIKGVGVQGGVKQWYSDLEITFRGRDILSAMEL